MLKNTRADIINLIKTVQFILICSLVSHAYAQCLSSSNPVGGTDNLVVLKKNTLLINLLESSAYSNQYNEGWKQSDYNLISDAYYNYIGFVCAYGISKSISIEAKTGYFANKTQIYNTTPEYKMKGNGLSGSIISGKFSLYSDTDKRLFYSLSSGIRIPSSRSYQEVNNVVLPIELQPDHGSWGAVLQSHLVKENSFKGIRYFLINKFETYLTNSEGYQPGCLLINSFFFSKHLMFAWLGKSEWTTIFQLRNEYRTHDILNNEKVKSSGSVLFFFTPQLTYSIHDKWNFSILTDIPLLQHFNGTQLRSEYSGTVSISRIIDFNNNKT